MNAHENVWRQMAKTQTAAALRAEMEPYLRVMLRRAADGGEGTVSERLRGVAGEGGARRLAAALCARLLGPGRDTVLLTETLAG